MRVFSASIETFLKKLTVFSRKILSDEFGVRVARTRFHTRDGWSWPIVIVAIDDKARLGYFSATDFTIGINKSLMYSAKDRVIKDLLRHEFAHYFTYIEHHDSDVDFSAHGVEFRAICDRYRLDPQVRRATVDIREENDAIEGDLKSEEVIAKIQKLMSLAESDNEHEAELATLRANELMVKHNLDANAAAAGDEWDVEYCVKLVIGCKRIGPRVAAIAKILREFFVYPVQGTDGLEVTGTRPNVENAEYIASYLNRELAALWKKARAGNRRLREKSFMMALAASYTQKLKSARNRLPESDRRALIVIHEDLERAGSGAYGGGLRTTSSTYKNCRESASRGAEAGSNLSIRRGVGSSGMVKLLGS